MSKKPKKLRLASAHAWCLKAPSGKLWPALCANQSKTVRKNAEQFCPRLDAKHPHDWKGLYRVGYRVVRVYIKEFKPL